MNFIKGIKSWPIEKKRIFSVSVALILTILIIVLNSGINLLWGDKKTNNISDKNNPVNTLSESFSKIFNDFQSVTKQISSSTTIIMDQINSTSSSLSTGTNVVR